MPKLVIGMKNNLFYQGFTLIEILIVLSIIGITLSFGLLAFGDFGSSRNITTAAEQFVNYVKLTQQQAILEVGTFGVRINQNQYEAMRFQPPSHWESMSSQSIFRKRSFPKNAVVRLVTSASSRGTPQIIIHASGDMTPFKLHVGTEKQWNTIIGEFDGNILLRPSTQSN